MNNTTPILDRLSDKRVFSVKLSDSGKFKFKERCDGYFADFLSKEEVLALADELIKMAGGRTVAETRKIWLEKSESLAKEAAFYQREYGFLGGKEQFRD